MASGAAAMMYNQQQQMINYYKWVRAMAWESNYDIGMGLLVYPKRKSGWRKLKEWFNNQ